MSRRTLLCIILGVALLLLGVGLYQHFHQARGVIPDDTHSRANPQSNTPGAASRYPDLRLTPGVIDPQMTTEKLCIHNYTKDTRHVTEAMKKEVFERYGLSYDDRGRGVWEVDHFIARILGGADTIENLWPEKANPRPGFHEKDIVEVYLHHQVCSGKMTLSAAQEAIRKDWYAVYQEWLSKHGNKPKHHKGKEEIGGAVE